VFGQELRLKHVDDPDGLAIADFDGALDIVVVDDKAVLTVLISGQGPIEHHHPW
jgi:hypothetical protein